MVKKFLLAGMGAATVLGLTAAGASGISFPSMGQGTNESHVVQQSDQVGVTCATGAVRMATNVTDTLLSSVSIKADDIANCSGAEVQVVAYDVAGNVLGSTSNATRLGYPVVPGYVLGWGQDLTIPFTSNILAANVAKVRLTIADNIL